MNEQQLSPEEILIVKKYYRLYMNEDPPDFLDMKYDKNRHYDDDILEKDVSYLVDRYFIENGLKIYSEYSGEYCFTIKEDQIQTRKTEMIKCIKNARLTFTHYVGYDSLSYEECNFNCYIFDRYYKTIGVKWING